MTLIAAMAKEGSDSLENGYTEGIMESLSLFSELLGYRPPPRAFQVPHHEIFGALSEKAGAEVLFGPVAALSRIDNSLRMIKNQVSNMDKAKIDFFQQVAQGKQKAAVEGPEVFRYLMEEVLGSGSRGSEVLG